MIHSEKKYLAATLEALSLYVDLGERKVVEFENEKVDLMNDFILKNNNNFKSDNLKFSSKLKK
jgi:acyl-CoA thioester hydrolase